MQPGFFKIRNIYPYLSEGYSLKDVVIIRRKCSQSGAAELLLQNDLLPHISQKMVRYLGKGSCS